MATAHADELDAPPPRVGVARRWRRALGRDVLAVAAIVVVAIVVALAIAPDLFSTHSAIRPSVDRLEPPSAAHLMGTDQFGRDTFSRVAEGAQVSVAVGAVTALLAILLGVPIGAIAGYNYGTPLDDAIMRIMDILLAFPPIILAIAVIAALGTAPIELAVVTIPHIAKLLFVIGILYVPQVARVTRSAVLVERNEQYVLAEQALGAGHARILFRDILRNSVSPVLVLGTVLVANAIIAEASLSFLGLGIQPPQPSWGVMLSDAKTYVTSGEWWLTVFPGALIFLTVCSLNIIGDFLRDLLDPRELTRGDHG